MHTNKSLIANGVFRLSLAPSERFEFNQFLIVDEKTCLVHTGKNSFYEPLKAMVQETLAGRQLDYIVFSHVEADETGSMNSWLELYPGAQAVCNKVANINLEDCLVRPVKILKDGESISLGTKNMQLVNTPHFPHNWDAHMWLETTDQILFSSDFCCQGGICKPIVEQDISDTVIDYYVKGAFMPYGKTTNDNIDKIMALPIRAIAPMHGSVIVGNPVRTILENVKRDLLERS